MISRLYIMPTNQCNSSCSYCYIPVEERIKSGKDTELIRNVRQFICHLQQKGIPDNAQIRFIGGEPYLKPELMKAISDLFFTEIETGKVVINTNGTLVRDRYSAIFGSTDTSRIIHIVSLDGIEKIHNSRRKFNNGSGTFSSVTEGIAFLRAIEAQVYINMVLDPVTFSELGKFLGFLKNKLDIHELSVSMLYEPGKNGMTADEKFNLLRGVYYLADEYRIKITGHHRLLLGNQVSALKCRAGEITTLLNCNGKLNVCQRFVGRSGEAESIEEVLTGTDKSFGRLVKNCCYDSESVRLGEMLLDFYRNEFPHYLQCNELDKIIFGVIQ